MSRLPEPSDSGDSRVWRIIWPVLIGICLAPVLAVLIFAALVLAETPNLEGGLVLAHLFATALILAITGFRGYRRGLRWPNIVQRIYALHAITVSILTIFDLLMKSGYAGSFFVLLLVDMGVLLIVQPERDENLRSFGPMMFWTAGIVISLCLLLPIVTGGIMALRAEVIAGDAPYCIQTASRTDHYAYDEPHSLADLSAWRAWARLRGKGGSFLQRHAKLVVAGQPTRILYWSYRHLDFVDPQGRNWPDTFCTPKRHYARNLSIWPSWSIWTP